MADLERRIITGASSVLRPLLDILETDPETVVVSVHRNAQTEPERLVVVIAPTRADALQTALGPLVNVDRDDPLPDPTGPFPDPNVPLPDP